MSDQRKTKAQLIAELELLRWQLVTRQGTDATTSSSDPSPHTEQHTALLFSQSIVGAFFMQLDEPVRWDETVDKERVLDYIFIHQHMTDANDALFAQYQIDSSKLSSPPRNDHIAFFVHSMEHYDLTLRDAEQCFDILRTTLTIWKHSIEIELLYLLPLIVATQQSQSALFDSLASARQQEPTPQSRPTPVFVFDSGVSRSEIVKIDYQNLMNNLLRSLATSLPDSAQARVGNGLQEWFRNRFMDEMQGLYQGKYNGNNPPYSIWRTYPDLVRNAARLTHQ